MADPLRPVGVVPAADFDRLPPEDRLAATVAPGAAPDDAAAALAALGMSASPAIPKNLGKKEVERWVERIVPPRFKHLQKEICREVMGKQERGLHLV
ncbi:MAG: hypothetical protein Q7T11_06745, partial [Deltaproteobacteria bacterium]|nr:hypothetical protein [Deltaproteobacteria bacterium]